MNRELDVIYTKFKLGLLENKEYKINLLMVLLFDVSILLASFVLLIILEQISGITSWGVLEFSMFLAFALLNGKINFAITFRDFKQILLSGDFNNYVNKPISPFIFLVTERFNGANLLSGIVIVLPVTIVLSIFFEFTLLGWLLFIIGVVHCTLLFWFIEIIAFFLKDNSFIAVPIKRATWFFEEYVPLFLQNTSFFKFIGVIPSVIFAFLAVDVMRGNFEYLFLLIASTISIPVLILVCIIMWRGGIKKYEAYG